ncbi:DUF305 domain-containing protein [Streptomyces kronopolitis]|uniref:DUF305 domain-containing protein n=1 Tax=Streptomyces kronopolitis TaxID=1612435 RepID=UPI00367884A7
MNSVQRAVRRLAAVGIVVSGALLLAGCGSDDTKNTGRGSGDAPTAARQNPAPGASNDADVTFAQSMIPHHQQAVAMARLADGRAADPQITSLAASIEKAQGPEIRTMRSWLKAWGAPESSAQDMPGMDHDSKGMDGMPGMAGMMSAKDMTDLKAARGKDFDKKFARMMIGHHQGAVTMARDEQRNGRNATAKKLAGDVIEHQTAEIATMRTLLDRL